MNNKIIIWILTILILSFSVSALNRYYSPYVTGQYIDDTVLGQVNIVTPPLFLPQKLYEDGILSTPDATPNNFNFKKCSFIGNGDTNFHYLNSFDDIIVLTDNYLNFFDSSCNLLGAKIINGSLLSQPIILEGEDKFVIAYISKVGTSISQINWIEYYNDNMQNYNYKIIQNHGNGFCNGLYCDNNHNSCVSFCLNYSTSTTFDVFWNIETYYDDDFISSNVSLENIGWSTPLTTNYFRYYNPSTTSYYNVWDNTSFMLTGMDINQDGYVDVASLYPSSNTGDWDLSIITPALGAEQSHISGIFTWSNGGTHDIYSLLNMFQIANIGVVTSNGELFTSFTTGISSESKLKVQQLDGTLIKSLPVKTGMKQISNWAVGDVDGDLKKDYCMAYNDTQSSGYSLNLTRIICYKGSDNLILTNCTIDWKDSNSPIGLSLMDYNTNDNYYLEAVTPMGIYEITSSTGLSSCDEYYTFSELDSSSDGVLVPLEFSTTDYPSLIYVGTDGAYGYMQSIVPIETISTICPASHDIFCDNFNYINSYYDVKGWEIFLNGVVDIDLSPLDYQMYMPSNTRFIARNILPKTDVNYQIKQNMKLLKSDVYPIVTSEFNVTNSSSATEFRFEVDDMFYRPSVWVSIYNNSISYAKTDNEYIGVYTNWTTIYYNAPFHNVKITQYLGRDSISYCSYANCGSDINDAMVYFNVTQSYSHYDIYLDNILIAQNIPYASFYSYSISNLILSKGSVNNFTIDNLYIYRGHDKAINTESSYIIPLVFNDTSTETLPYEASKDTATNIERGIESFGFLSTASKLLLAIVLILISIVGIAIMMGKAGVEGIATTIVIVSVLFLEFILFVYLHLIPIWIVFLLLLVASASAFMFVKLTSGTGG